MTEAIGSVTIDSIFGDANISLEVFDSLLTRLQAMPATSFSSGKGFYKTYPKRWESLSVDQKAKTRLFVSKELDVAKQVALHNLIISDAATQEGAIAEQNTHTNKHDKCRILHLRGDSRLFSTWTRAFQPLTRPQLDARKTTQVIEDDPWAQLAEAFNDYSEFQYQNACVQYDG